MPTSALTELRLFRHVLLGFVLLAAVLVALAGRTSDLRDTAGPQSAPSGTSVSQHARPAPQIPLP
jgi:hypothetical protein